MADPEFPEIDAVQFRQTLGQYPTGVVVVTGVGADGEALGMTVGSFTSVSLDPPLVAFLPDQGSSSWAALRAAGPGFCVNILGADQEDVCRQVATRKKDKLEGVAWRPSAQGNPVLEAAVAHIDCVTDVVHEAGDHHIVVGRVLELDVHRGGSPLLFFRGGYGSFRPASLAAADADLLEQLRSVDLGRSVMEELAARFDTEVSAMSLVGGELVVAAAAGITRQSAAPTRVGQRIPFLPPFGSPYAAWGGPALLDRWLDALGPNPATDAVEEFRSMADRVREQGYSLALDHPLTERIEEIKASLHDGVPGATEAELLGLVRDQMATYNPTDLDRSRPLALRSVLVPVFDPAGQVAFLLTLWAPGRLLDPMEVEEHIAGAVGAAARISSLLTRRAAVAPAR